MGLEGNQQIIKSEQGRLDKIDQKVDQIWKKFIQDTEKISSNMENTAADNLLADL